LHAFPLISLILLTFNRVLEPKFLHFSETPEGIRQLPPHLIFMYTQICKVFHQANVRWEVPENAVLIQIHLTKVFELDYLVRNVALNSVVLNSKEY